MNFKLTQELGGCSAESWLIAGGILLGKHLAVVWELCVPEGSDSCSSWRSLLVFHVELGQREGLAGGEAGGFHWVMGARERLWGQQGKEEEQGRGGGRADTRDEGADTSLGSGRQRRTLSSMNLHLFEGNLNFILVLLSTQHDHTVDVLPFLKAC